jgi:two-component system cell cycle sensor histidine kinase/response regulator CckA
VTNLNVLVDETLRLVGRMLDENIEVDAQLDPNLNSVLIDSGQLTQAILNLVVNARDAMPGDGTLTIRTANVELAEMYVAAHEGVVPGDYVLLQVTDSGTGIDAVDQARGFEPFFTTKDHGTGLGLAGVYGLVTQSRGQIWLYSKPNMGTTFRLYFPATAATQVPAVEPDDVGPLQGNESMLLVKDDEMVRSLVTSTLRTYGYEVLVAAGGREAIELAEQEAGAIDVLMTDVVMPGMNGRELAEKLQAKYPRRQGALHVGLPGGHDRTPQDLRSAHRLPGEAVSATRARAQDPRSTRLTESPASTFGARVASRARRPGGCVQPQRWATRDKW